MKVVLDANVIIAAFASRGLCESVLELCLAGHEVFVSAGLLDEVATNLRMKIKLPSQVVEGIEALLREHGTLIEPAPVSDDACRDPDDTKILGLTVASGADFLVTGDEDLLVLKKYEGVPIVSPRMFSEQVRRQDRPEE